MSVQHTQQTLQLPVKEKGSQREHTVPRAEASKYATCNKRQPGATVEHQPPSHSTCLMTIRTIFISPPGVRHSDIVVSVGTYIVSIENRRRTLGETDQHPSQLVTRPMNLHTQPLLTCENSPPCHLTSKNFYSSDFSSFVTNDCSRKPKASLPASVEPLTFPSPSGYIARSTGPNKLRDDEVYTVIKLSDYSPSCFDQRALSMSLKFTPNPPHVGRLNLKESLRCVDRSLRLREYLADSDSPVDSDTIKFRKKITRTPSPNRDNLWICFFPLSIQNQ